MYESRFVFNRNQHEQVHTEHPIGMPYHLLGIDFRDDPYLSLSDAPGERKKMKRLVLVAINADIEKKAISGFRGDTYKEVQKCSEILTDKGIKKMLEHARKVHAPIANYIHSGAGRELQNLDCRITEGILLRLLSDGIPCLPVHDSYIVPRQYGGLLKQVMTEEYERMLKFAPVIK